MGIVGKDTPVQIINMTNMEPIPLANDSWTRMVLTDKTVSGNGASLGYSIFRPGTVLSSVSHDVEELAYVIAGEGELRLENDVVTFGPHDALFIPPSTWHAVANTGDEELIMVFFFPFPDYPPTERR